MSSVEERSSENWSGVRMGLSVLVAGSWEGKMEMWRGLFCGGSLWVRFGCPRSQKRGSLLCGTYIPAYDA